MLGQFCLTESQNSCHGSSLPQLSVHVLCVPEYRTVHTGVGVRREDFQYSLVCRINQISSYLILKKIKKIFLLMEYSVFCSVNMVFGNVATKLLSMIFLFVLFFDQVSYVVI